MKNGQTGNRITDNALNADDGAKLIKFALESIKNNFGWKPEGKPLFSRIYYDIAKVGNYIIKLINKGN